MKEKSKLRKCWQLFVAFGTSMLFAFTGGSVTWPLVAQRLEHKYRLLDEEKTYGYFALGQSLPGVISLNGALLIGRSVAGWAGGLAAAAGVILPAFVGMLVIALSYTALMRLHFVTAAIQGIRAASIAIILGNAMTLAGLAQNAGDVALIAFAFVATLILGWGMIPVILLCGGLGVLRLWLQERRAAKDGRQEK